MSGDTSALTLILSGDPGLYRIIALSLIVSLSAVVCAAVIGIPLGALIALTRFRGRDGPEPSVVSYCAGRRRDGVHRR